MHSTCSIPASSLRRIAQQLGAAALLGLALCASPVHAQSHPQPHPQSHADHSHHAAEATSTAPATAILTDGEITRRDARTGKLTIRHGDIANLNMPAMTMVFGLASGLPNTWKVGDKVRFHAEEVNGELVITEIAPQP